MKKRNSITTSPARLVHFYIASLGIVDRTLLARRVRTEQWDLLTSREREFIADLLEGKVKNPRNRPKSAAAEILRCELAQAYMFLRQAHPEWQEKEIVGEVSEFFEVTPGYVRRALREITPEQRKAPEAPLQIPFASPSKSE
jgi:hypothetical protein